MGRLGHRTHVLLQACKAVAPSWSFVLFFSNFHYKYIESFHCTFCAWTSHSCVSSLYFCAVWWGISSGLSYPLAQLLNFPLSAFSSPESLCGSFFLISAHSLCTLIRLLISLVLFCRLLQIDSIPADPVMWILLFVVFVDSSLYGPMSCVVHNFFFYCEVMFRGKYPLAKRVLLQEPQGLSLVFDPIDSPSIWGPMMKLIM